MPTKKKAPARKAAPKAKKPQKKAVPKKSVKKSAPAKNTLKTSPKKQLKKPTKKPALKIVKKQATKKPTVVKKEESTRPKPKPISIVVNRRRDREPSVFQRSSEPRGPGGVPLNPDAAKPVGLDRTRLGALQAKFFSTDIDFETRQKLAHMVSDISVAASKPRIQRTQMLAELKKVSAIAKKAVKDSAVREAMLNDIDAFSAVVRGK